MRRQRLPTGSPLPSLGFMDVQTGVDTDVELTADTVVDAGIGQPGAVAAPDKRGEPRERDPLWRDLIGEVLRRERQAQQRTLQEVADAARISMPYLSELERGRKEASSEILAAAARALGLRLSDLISLAHGRLGEYERVAAAGRSVGVTSRDSLCLAA